jgi:hypothetical protein
MVPALAFAVCPIRAVTGRRCPGCGMTRACLLLSHGHPVRATTMHPAVWLWVVLLARDTCRGMRASSARDRVVSPEPTMVAPSAMYEVAVLEATPPAHGDGSATTSSAALAMSQRL